MKYIDKFLKLLKTDRNTFVTFILTLITAYLVVDRVVELLIMIFTGISASYWGPIQYTLAFACPVFAFIFSGSSKFVTSDKIKLSFFYSYVISLYILIISMVTQWLNATCWFVLLSLPNYPVIATECGDLIQPALCWLAAYIPLSTFYPVVQWILTKINDTKDIKDSIYDYKGISLSDKSKGTGPYTCEIAIGKDKTTGKAPKIPEIRRFNQMLVVGISGSGKTSMIFEPMIAQDIDKKFFLRENSKELAFVALKSGIATLTCPYDNDYINSNFNLNMIKPVESKLKIFQVYMKKMIYNIYDKKMIYRNLGITYMCPDFESISRILDVAKCYKMKVNLIDPNDRNSPGLNPFIFDDPLKTSIAISTVLQGLYGRTAPDLELAYRENFSNQAIENITILLKEMYPRLNNGELPTLEDMLSLLNDFKAVEHMCEQMKAIPELVEKYPMVVNYFKRNFYENGIGRAETEKFIYSASTQLDNLLRHPGVRAILCNRTNNINYDKALANGEITLVCTRRGDLGAAAHKAFGLFFLMLMQYSVLRRPGNEDSRIPHFLYIDEFPDFMCSSTEAIFTLYRKYKVGSVISAQNLSQLGAEKNKFGRTIIANCANKIVFGNNSPDDNDWWSKELGEKREWDWNTTYDMSKGEYDSKAAMIKYKFKDNYAPGKVQALKGKQCMYKFRDLNNKNVVGTANLDYLEAKYKENQSVKKFNFEKFSTTTTQASSSSDDDDNTSSSIFAKKKNSILKGFSQYDNSDEELDPIKLDNSDSEYEFEHEDAILFSNKKGLFNKKKK